MSVRHIKEYSQKIDNQYYQMVDILRELEKELADKIIDPEIIDNFKATMEPIKINKDRIDYILFLLNTPNKKSKQKSYEKQNRELIKKYHQNSSTLKDVLNEGDECLQKLHNVVDNN